MYKCWGVTVNTGGLCTTCPSYFFELVESGGDAKGDKERGVTTRHGDRWAGPLGAQLVVRRASVTSGMSFVHLAEVEGAVPPVEHALNVVRIEQEPILLPT